MHDSGSSKPPKLNIGVHLTMEERARRIKLVKRAMGFLEDPDDYNRLSMVRDTLMGRINEAHDGKSLIAFYSDIHEDLQIPYGEVPREIYDRLVMGCEIRVEIVGEEVMVFSKCNHQE